MPRRGENIRKRKDGRWEARYIDSYDLEGKAKYKSVYGYAYLEVKQKLKYQNGNRNTNTQTSFINFNMTVEKLCYEWLDSVQIKLKQSSYANYFNVITKHIIPKLKNVRVHFITNEVVNSFIKEKSTNGRLDGKGGLSPKTVYDISRILLQIIKFGEVRRYILNFNYDITLPPKEYAELPVLTVSEQEKLKNHIQNNLDCKSLGVLISLYTGVRLGELCALQWKDIDFYEEEIKVTKTLQRIKNTDENDNRKTKVIIDKPKSVKSVRNIPLPSFLFNILKEYRKGYTADTYILTGNLRYMDNRVYQDKFKQYIKLAGLQDINFHATRHTFATRAIEHGIDVKTVSELLGHSSVKFTLERYVHSSKEHKRQSIEKLAACY